MGEEDFGGCVPHTALQHSRDIYERSVGRMRPHHRSVDNGVDAAMAGEQGEGGVDALQCGTKEGGQGGCNGPVAQDGADVAGE